LKKRVSREEALPVTLQGQLQPFAEIELEPRCSRMITSRAMLQWQATQSSCTLSNTGTSTTHNFLEFAEVSSSTFDRSREAEKTSFDLQ
jgi:hypothetical protein